LRRYTAFSGLILSNDIDVRNVRKGSRAKTGIKKEIRMKNWMMLLLVACVAVCATDAEAKKSKKAALKVMTQGQYIAARKKAVVAAGKTFDPQAVRAEFAEVDTDQDGSASVAEQKAYKAKKKAEASEGEESE
jgi:hypothetical protein